MFLISYMRNCRMGKEVDWGLQSLVVAIEGLTPGTEWQTRRKNDDLPSDSETLNMRSSVQGSYIFISWQPTPLVVRNIMLFTLKVHIFVFIQCTTQPTTFWVRSPLLLDLFTFQTSTTSCKLSWKKSKGFRLEKEAHLILHYGKVRGYILNFALFSSHNASFEIINLSKAVSSLANTLAVAFPNTSLEPGGTQKNLGMDVRLGFWLPPDGKTGDKPNLQTHYSNQIFCFTLQSINFSTKSNIFATYP